MAEYIDKENIIFDYSGLAKIAPNDFMGISKYFADQIKVIPAADVAPVVHGQWITEFDDLGWLKHTCTVCGYTKRTDVHVSLGWNYCPNCGARMDGAEND